MHKFPCKQDDNHLTTGDALPPNRFLTHRPPCPPQRTYSFMSQLPEQISSAFLPSPVNLVNGIQCPLRDKILLRPTVSSKTSTSNIKDGGLGGTSQLFKYPQSTLTPQISTQPVRKLFSYPLILELANIQPRLGLCHSPGFKVQLKSCCKQAGGQF